MSTTIPHQAVIPAGTWRSDPVHSTVEFSARHMVVSTFRGQLPEFAVVVESGPDGASLVGTAPVAKVTTEQPDLTAHLRSPEFFDAERHPVAEFRGDSVEPTGEDTVLVRGELTLRGVTRPVELRGTIAGPVTDPYGNQRLGLELETAIDRFEYGMKWNMPLPDGGVALGREVRLHAALELLREA